MPTVTVIRLKYIEKSAEGEETSSSGNMNGNLKESMINIDCGIGLVIDYVRRMASLEGEFDLCEETTNNMKNVNSFPSWTRGTEILVPGCLLKCGKESFPENSKLPKIFPDGDSEGRISRVLPMINTKSSKIAVDIMSRIHAPHGKNKSTSLTGKITQEKLGGRNTHQEKRNKVGKPASRAKEGQGR